MTISIAIVPMMLTRRLRLMMRKLVGRRIRMLTGKKVPTEPQIDGVDWDETIDLD